MRIEKTSKVRVAAMIRKMNIGLEYGPYSSGAEGRLRRGYKLSGGFLIKEQEKVIGWGAAWEDGEFHCYVSSKHRGSGIGDKLCQRAVKHFPEHSFCPWNRRLTNFFSRKNYPIHQNWRGIL